jgi:transposase
VGRFGATDAVAGGAVSAWTDHRLAVEGMAWKYRTGAPWRDVPERFGKWNTIYKRFTRWAEDGTWAKLLAEVHKRADAAGKIDWVVSIDSTIARVHQHGATLKRDTGGCTESQESSRRAA